MSLKCGLKRKRQKSKNTFDQERFSSISQPFRPSINKSIASAESKIERQTGRQTDRISIRHRHLSRIGTCYDLELVISIRHRHLSRHRHRKRPDSVPHRCQISFSLRLDNLPAAEPLSSSPTVRFAAAFCDFPLLPLGLAASGCPVGPQQPTTTSAPAQSHRHLLPRPRHPPSHLSRWHWQRTRLPKIEENPVWTMNL